MLASEETGSSTIAYVYSQTGEALGFTYGGQKYFYLKNAQGDIISICNSAGTVVVSYTYDTWGKPLSVTGTLASTVGAANSLRYRGYYYDSETGLYYLRSRYYDPETGRFINADGFVTTGQGFTSFNMFAYCLDNPVNCKDDTGNRAVKNDHNESIGELTEGLSAENVAYVLGRGTATNSIVQEETKLIVAQTIYGEEHGRTVYSDWQQGQQAVASVILNRQTAKISYLGIDLKTICTNGQFDGYYSGKKAYESGTYDVIAWDSAMSLATSIVTGGNIDSPNGINSNYLYFNANDTFNSNVTKNGGKFSFGPGTTLVTPIGIAVYGGNTFFYY